MGQAKNSNASIGDRVSAGANAVTEGAKELVEGGKKEYQGQKAEGAKENVKDKVTPDSSNSGSDKGIIESTTEYISDTIESVGEYLGATTKQAEHKAKEEGHKAQRK